MSGLSALLPAARRTPRFIGPITAARLRRVLLRTTLVAASVALFGRLLIEGWPEVRRASTEMMAERSSMVVLLGVVVLQVVWIAASANASRGSIAAVGGRVSGRDAVRIVMAAFTLSRVVPGGGAAGGVFATRELILMGHPAAVAMSAMIVSWAVATTTLASLMLIGAIAATTTGQIAFSYLIPSLAALAGLAGAGLIAVRVLSNASQRERLLGVVAGLLRRLGRSDRPVMRVSESLDGVAANLRDRRRLLHAASWSATAWSADAAAMWLVFYAFGHTLRLREIVIGYAFANLLNSMPELTPGWIGVFESAMSAAFVGLGVPGGVAVAAVLTYRLTSFWLPVTAGIVPALTSLAGQRRASIEDEIPQEVTA